MAGVHVVVSVTSSTTAGPVLTPARPMSPGLTSWLAIVATGSVMADGLLDLLRGERLGDGVIVGHRDHRGSAQVQPGRQRGLRVHGGRRRAELSRRQGERGPGRGDLGARAGPDD